MKSILALDISKTGTGYAFGVPGERPICGVERLAREGGVDDDVFARGIVWLTQTIGAFSPQIVAIEAPIMSSGGGQTNPSSQAMLLGLQGALRGVVAIKLPSPAVLVASSTARKTFTGKGSYPKNEAKAAVQAEVIRRGWLAIEDMQSDKADALCLWSHMAAQQMPEMAFSRGRK